VTTRNLVELQRQITSTWATDAIGSTLLRLFSGEQQQVGESLRQLNKQDKWECMGYGAFLKTYPRGADPLLDALRRDIDVMRVSIEDARPRMRRLHTDLRQLLDLLDPDNISFTEHEVPEGKN
jgi:hypothetical protein